MPEPEALRFEDGGDIPNSVLPLLLYRGALAGDREEDLATAFEALFARHGWGGSWRNGIYSYHHFHSTAHEVLGIARGRVRVLLGGPAGRTVELRAGDAVVIPAGVGHCNEGSRADLLVIGAYPVGQEPDLQRAADAAARGRIPRVPKPARDPVTGAPIWTRT